MPRLNVVLDDETHRRAKAAASLGGQSLQDFVTEAVKAQLGADDDDGGASAEAVAALRDELQELRRQIERRRSR
ncbi:MAG: hypothetical protein J2P57_11470 [Acidimicrobiaceae bacterium]|nr:hypothetical protein [Acidimicrobiaceae bacterium]